jgi:hypothetical protein
VSPASVIVDLLGPLVAGRVYASVFPQEDTAPTWPAIRFTVVADTPFPDQCGSEDTDSDDTRVQIDIVADGYDEVLALKAAAIAALATSTPAALREPGGFETYDADTRTHRAVLDYTFQPSSA